MFAELRHEGGEEGFGGPVGDGKRVLMVVDAENRTDVEARLAPDPWMTMGILRVGAIEPWEILLDGRAQRRGQ